MTGYISLRLTQRGYPYKVRARCLISSTWAGWIAVCPFLRGFEIRHDFRAQPLFFQKVDDDGNRNSQVVQ